MLSKFSKFNKGLTLLEVLISMAIMALMMAVVLMNNHKENRIRTEVDAAAREISVQLRSLQNDALNGKYIDDASGKHFACRAIMTPTMLTSNYEISYNENCATAPPDGALINGSEILFVLKNVDIESMTYGPAPGTPINLIMFKNPVGAITVSDNVKILLRSKTDPAVKGTVCINANSRDITEIKDDASCL